MESIFERLWRLKPAAFVVKAIVAAIVADALLLAFILLRRTYRKRYFAKRDARVFELRQKWDTLISGKIPYETWRKKPFDRRIVETMALDSFEASGSEESARLLKFLRQSGLIEKRICEARRQTGWRRMRSLVALGRTRAPEGIPALAEALRDHDLEVRLAALRGLGRMACPEAGEEILAWVGRKGPVRARAALTKRVDPVLRGTAAAASSLRPTRRGSLAGSPRPGSWGSSDPVSRLGSASICRRRP